MKNVATRVDTIHATTIAVGDTGLAIVGEAGLGKTTLALNCCAIPSGPYGQTAAALVADDYTVVTQSHDALVASAPPNTAGLVEMRGIGIVRIATQPTARLVCVLELVIETVARLPETRAATTVLDRVLPTLKLQRNDPALAVKALSWLAINSGHVDAVEVGRTMVSSLKPRG